MLPKHINYEHTGIAPVQALSQRLKVPVEHPKLAELVCRLHLQAHQALELRPATVLKLFEQLDAFRRPDRLENFLLACEADKRGRLGHAETPYPQADYLREAFAAARAITVQAFVVAGLEGPAIAEAQRQARIKAIADLRTIDSGPPMGTEGVPRLL